MNFENFQRVGLEQKAVREATEFAVMFLYLAFLFCVLATYSMLLLNEFHAWYSNYSLALFNAFVVAHVIPIGKHMHLGKKEEGKPLLFSAVAKAFLFTLLVLVFHVVEEWAKRLVNMGTYEMRIDDLFVRSLIIFCVFIPLFSFMEVRRVMGEDKFRDLFLRK